MNHGPVGGRRLSRAPDAIKPSRGLRVLVYSHDTFGLGHLCRCRTISHFLASRYHELNVLILSGSPIIGSFDFKARVDFVRIPGVIKLQNGEYTSFSLGIDTEQTVSMRASIIRHTAEIFAPDLFLVDKEPMGLCSEITDTLHALKRQGSRVVLGLRDIMDETELLRQEWQAKGVMPALRDLYDEIWVYGPEVMGDPLTDSRASSPMRDKSIFTGYLKRQVTRDFAPGNGSPIAVDEPYLLVTTGGGGDGVALIDWVLGAYETDSTIPDQALIVFGPFLPLRLRARFEARVSKLDRVEAITFHTHMESLIAGARGIVAMGGHNTFSEILSFDKPSLLVPREARRREQLIRAERAASLGLTRMLRDDGQRAARMMAAALHELPHQPPPSRANISGLLDGLPTIDRRFGECVGIRERTPVSALPVGSDRTSEPT